MNGMDRNNFVCLFFLALLMLCCHGCLFGGNNKKEDKAVYPVTTMPTPTKEPEKEPEEQPAKKQKEQNSSLKVLQQEVSKELNDLSKEMKETHGDLLTRTAALEEDYKQLTEKISLLEFLQGEASGKTAKMQERLEFELETIRQQIEDYNALLINILDKISASPDAAQLEAPAFPEMPK